MRVQEADVRIPTRNLEPCPPPRTLNPLPITISFCLQTGVKLTKVLANNVT